MTTITQSTGRAEIEAAIELLIGLLDQIDGDADFEQDGDEFDQGVPEGWRKTRQPYEDAEDDDPPEDNADDEPSLGGAGIEVDLEQDLSDLEVSEPDTFHPHGSHVFGGGSGI